MASDAVAAGELACDELDVGGRRAGEEGRTAGLDGLGPWRGRWLPPETAVTGLPLR